MKTILNYLRQRRERKLRMWCVEQAIAASSMFNDRLTKSAQEIRDWVTANQQNDKSGSTSAIPQSVVNHLETMERDSQLRRTLSQQ